MGMGLRGNNRSPSDRNDSDTQSTSNQKVTNKRNNLKEMVIGELAIKKGPLTGISSNISSGESND